MAKQSIVAIIKAKPNARGKRSHIPMPCTTKDCKNDAMIYKGTFSKRVRLCEGCYYNPPQKVRAISKRKQAENDLLRQLGVMI